MEIYRNLSILAEDADQLDDLMEEVSRSLPTGWSRDELAEELNEYYLEKKGQYHFRSHSGDRFPACDLILIPPRPPSPGVSSIHVRDNGRLTMRDCNAAIEEFAEKVIGPLAKKRGMNIELTSDQFELSQWMSEAAAEKLRIFCRLANKGLGGAAPADSARWLDFVVTAHRDGCRLPPEVLRQWLIEDGGWYFDVADRLAGEYAFGGEILTFAEHQPA